MYNSEAESLSRNKRQRVPGRLRTYKSQKKNWKSWHEVISLSVLRNEKKPRHEPGSTTGCAIHYSSVNSVFIKIYANLPPRKRPNVFLIRRTLPTSSLGPWVQAVWRPSCDYTCCAELITHFWSECFIRTASAHHVKLIYIRLRAACRTLS